MLGDQCRELRGGFNQNPSSSGRCHSHRRECLLQRTKLRTACRCSEGCYNAALKKAITRSPSGFEYSPRYLRYGTAFQGGFKEDNQHLKKEALEMEEWLISIKRNYITPNIDMYDAIIQAWIDTGSLDGLLRAEEWAKR
jgi:hypothetical protein